MERAKKEDLEEVMKANNERRFIVFQFAVGLHLLPHFRGRNGTDVRNGIARDADAVFWNKREKSQ
jgi:hypothetical protein